MAAETPAQVENRPGLSAIVYRAGTHAQFKATLLARLSGSRQGALRGLTTRADDDFTMALLDAWAIVADVLTFYQERIANESYLRTASERLSIVELARLIGYRPRPGAAAAVYLAFTIEDAPGALGPAINLGSSAQVVLEPPPPVPIPIGVKVQSVPGPGEKAQVYETIEAIEGRPQWNAMKPRLTRPQLITAGMGSVILSGTATNLQPGDTLLIVQNGKPKTRVAQAVAPLTMMTGAGPIEVTRVDFEKPALSPEPDPTLTPGSLTDIAPDSELDEATLRQIVARKWRAEDLSALAKAQGWTEAALARSIDELTSRRPVASDRGLFAFRQRAAVFGYNAPRYELLTKPGSLEDWEGRTLAEDAKARGQPRSVDLDNVYPGLIPEGWVALSGPSVSPVPIPIEKVQEISRSDFAISGKISRVTLKDETSFDSLTIRETGVLARSESLGPADVPIEQEVSGDTVQLDRAYLGLETGRVVILSGIRSDLPSETANETRTLKEVGIENGFTVLVLDRPLAYRYLPGTVAVNANVALATHGESVSEVLGGGDAATAFQAFTLRQPPLTYTGGATATGAQSTLEVRVNGLRWDEVPRFYGHGPAERIFVTRHDSESRTTITFGDGRTGARTPTGPENLTARYRKGSGLGGLVKAGQLSQLMTRPLGVRGVTNPGAASGASDPETLEDARTKAPLTALTLERVVSLQDYEDFAYAFAGIGKALATWVWTGQRRAVHLTVAGAGGEQVDLDGTVGTNLLGALQVAGDSRVSLILQSYQPRFFILSAAVKVDEAYVPDQVLKGVEATLRASFSFAARGFGQSVSLSEVIALIMKVPGVVAVDVNDFYRTDAPPKAGESRVKPRLDARRPRVGGDSIFPAQLLTIDPRPIVLEVLS